MYGMFVNTYNKYTSVAVQKLITFIDVRSAMFCSNFMENNCNFEL